MARGKDFRGVYREIDPKDELDDYSGPFRPNLRFSDFSKKQLHRMHMMDGEYIMELIIAHNTYVSEKFGAEAVMEMGKRVWADLIPPAAYRLLRNAMNIKGKTIEDLMKGLQIDSTYIPCEFAIEAHGGKGCKGSRFDITFEMPSKNRGILTVNRCPAVDMNEALGHAASQKDYCLLSGAGYFIAYAKLHDPDIETNIIKLPPRENKSDICCKYEFTYKAKKLKKSK